MKQATIECLKRLFPVVLAFFGLTSSSYGQTADEWTLVDEESLLSETVSPGDWSQATKDFISNLPENWYAEVPGDGAQGELKYNKNCKDPDGYPVHFASNGQTGDFFCIKKDLEPGMYRFTYKIKLTSSFNEGPMDFFYSKGDPATAEKNLVGDNVELTYSYADYSYEFEVVEADNYNMGLIPCGTPAGGYGNYAISYFKLEKKADSSTPKHDVTVPVVENGTVTVNNGDEVVVNEGETVKVEEGTQLTVVATPDEYYEINELKVGDNPVESGATFDVNAATEISASFRLKQAAVTLTFTDTEGSAEIQREVEGEWVKVEEAELAAVGFGTELRVVVAPETGYDVASVSKNDEVLKVDNADGNYYFTVDETPIEVKVLFDQNGYTLTTAVLPADADPAAGTVTVMKLVEGTETEIDGNLHYGDVITVAVEAADGYQWNDKLTVEGAVPVADTDNQYTVKGNVTVTAEFDKVWTVTVAKVENGTLTVMNGDIKLAEGENIVPDGAVLKVTFEAAAGYELDVLSPEMTEKTEGDDTYYEYTVEADVTVSVTFRQIDYTLTTVVLPEDADPAAGTVTVKRLVDGTETEIEGALHYGDIITFSVEAADGYQWNDKLTVEGAEPIADADNQYTVKGNVTVTAEFDKVWTVTVAKVENGTLTVMNGDTQLAEGENIVPDGAVLKVTFEAAAGYELDVLAPEMTKKTEGDDTYYEYTVEADVTVSVTFKQTTSIDSVSATGVYFNASEEVLYTAGAASVNVYDLTGSVVLSAENVEALNVSELPAGVYVAAVDGVTVKFCK